MSRPRSLSSIWRFPAAISILLVHGLAVANPARCADDLKCRSHLDRGMALDLAGNYEWALRQFQAAYKQQKDPRLALNIGRTLHKLGRFAEAIPWYKDAGRAAPADAVLHKQLQEFITEAQQLLPAVAPGQNTVTIVNQPTIAVQTPPPSVISTVNAINNNIIRLDPASLLPANQPVSKPLYKRASLWVPIAGLVLSAGAAGVAAAVATLPWQPDAHIPMSVLSATSVGGAR